MRSASPFQITDGETFSVDDLTFTTTPPPLPVSIVAAANPTVVELDQSSAMTVIATLADGSTQDVTAATEWTTYTTSNPAIATVNQDGVVTGHGVGIAFITAKNGAATAVEQIFVTAEALPRTIVGSVALPDGTLVEGAVLVTPLGGNAVSGAGGLFELTVTVLQQTTGLNVTAVAQVDGQTYSRHRPYQPHRSRRRDRCRRNHNQCRDRL